MQGVLLAERFRIGDRLGAGGMGQVWAAQDERMRRDVAVKVVHPQYGMDEAETQARFQREVQLAGRLSHQNIVTVHDWGEVAVDGRQTLFLVMELVHGVPLHRRFAESTPTWPLAVGWGAQIAEALSAAHAQGVVHRDIKPANALLTPDGTVKVLDFGVAKFMGETIGARELTVTGVPLGSPPYMSPEQADGDRAIDHRSDLYSLGCLLYHAVTGRPPFTGSSQWAVLRKQMEETPESPGWYAEGLPSLLNDLILNLLAKRPEDRPADAAVVCDALCALLVDQAVLQSRDDLLETARLVHTASVPGRLLTAARLKADRLLKAATDEAARRRIHAEHELELRRQAVEAQISEDMAAAERAREQALDDARAEAKRFVEEARQHARRLVGGAVHEADTARALAERWAVEARASGRSAEKVVMEALAEADRIVAQAKESVRGIAPVPHGADHIDVLKSAGENPEATAEQSTLAGGGGEQTGRDGGPASQDGTSRSVPVVELMGRRFSGGPQAPRRRAPGGAMRSVAEFLGLIDGDHDDLDEEAPSPENTSAPEPSGEMMPSPQADTSAEPFRPFWLAVPEARQIMPEGGGPAPVAELVPGTWYLAVEQRGPALVVQTQSGRRGILEDTSGIQRG
ncbi:protein kinase domain-containing protein [Streptomyces sp. 4N124]|uniref:protein kinase domain-containing protein n=1 Tax=Streptomyces sp. 4N124 TaxID=3457420 RepID=UPI003FD0B676